MSEASEAEVVGGGCYTCADYLRHRRDTLAIHIASVTKASGEDPIELAKRFMGNAHQRHLDGIPLRPGGPTRVSDPRLGHIAALMALIAPPATADHQGPPACGTGGE